MPKWATSFGAQVIYGLIIGLVIAIVIGAVIGFEHHALVSFLHEVGALRVPTASRGFHRIARSSLGA